jgi:hypothetical protein
MHESGESGQRAVIAMRAKIDRGLAQLERGEGIPGSEAVRRLRANRRQNPVVDGARDIPTVLKRQ